jgi:hypothetical protein
MADCYFHGQTPPGSCPYCVQEQKEGLDQGSIRLGRDELNDNFRAWKEHHETLGK